METTEKETKRPVWEAIPIGMFEKAVPVELSWPERLAVAAEGGYDYVEMSIDEKQHRIDRLDWDKQKRKELRDAVLDSGVPLMSVSFSSHRTYAMGSLDDKVRDTGIEMLRRMIDFAADVGLRYILVAGSDIYYEESTEETRARFLGGLEKGFEWASAAGVMLALENWDIRINTMRKAMFYVEHFNSPWFQLYVDVGNMTFAGFDDATVLAELELAKGHIAAVHVKDTLPGQLRYVPLGEGAAPLVDCFAKLAEIGFQGPAALELWTEKDPDAIAIASAASGWLREHLQKGWAQAGY